MGESRVNIVVALDGENASAIAAVEGVNSEIAKIEEAAKTVGKSVSDSLNAATKGTEGLSDGAKTAGKSIKQSFYEVVDSTKQVETCLNNCKTAVMGLAGVKWLAGQVKDLIDMADAYNQMTARIKLATKETGNYAEVTGDLQRISRQTHTQFSSNAEIYLRTDKIMRELGFATEDTMGLVEGLSTSLVINGADAQKTDSAINALAKSLTVGKIGMKEFTAMSASSPRVLQALADGLGVSNLELRQMAASGKLTAEKVIPAMNSQLKKLSEEAGTMPVTVGKAATSLKEALTTWIGKADEASGATQAIAKVMDVLAKNIGIVMAALTALATFILITMVRVSIPCLITAYKALKDTAVACAKFSRDAWDSVTASLGRLKTASISAETAMGKLGRAALIVTTALVAYEFGTWLRDQFAIARVAGVFMVQALEYGIEQLQYRWEQFKALFTSDTLAEVEKRHYQRLAEMNAIFKDMYADAWGETVEVVKTAAQKIQEQVDQANKAAVTSLGAAAEAVKTSLEGVTKELDAIEKQATAANSTISAAMSGISSAYQGMAGIFAQQVSDEMAALTERYNKEVEELDRVQQHKGLLIEQQTQLFAQLIAAETALTKESTAERIRLIEEEGRLRVEVAARQGATEAERQANATRVENEILTEKKAALQTALGDYRKHINDLNAEANRHLAEIKRIDAEERQLHMSTADAIRELQRSTMTDYQAYQDKQSQIAELQAKARAALAAGEYDTAKEYAKKAMDLAKQSADAVKQGDTEVISKKQAVAKAIENMNSAEELLTKALAEERNAHKGASDAAIESRDKVAKTFADTQEDIDNLSRKLAAGLNTTINVDTKAVDEALVKLDEAIAKRETLLPIKADLEQAQKDIAALKDSLEKGGLSVTVDTEKAREALDKLKTYAETTGNIELRLATKEADAAIKDVETKLNALSKVQTESKHQVNDNVDQVKASIDSLNNRNTSSTHTVYEQHVQASATGGLIRPAKFAGGGAVGFPGMSGGTVPGVGNGDTVPRALDAGSFVVRKAAVQKYGQMLLSRLAAVRFAFGGSVGKKTQATEEEKVAYDRLNKLISASTGLPRPKYGMGQREWATRIRDKFWQTTPEKRQMIVNLLAESFEGWLRGARQAQQLKRPLVMSMDMLGYLAMNQGGSASAAGSDTVPAMLTPGEYVINRDAVKRLGVGFLSALNAMKVPAQILADRVQRFAIGGLVDGGANLARSVMPAYSMPAFSGMPGTAAVAAPSRTLRLELSVGGRTVNASLNESEETKLLSAIAAARARAV